MVAELRHLGLFVTLLHAVGGGVPDLLVTVPSPGDLHKWGPLLRWINTKHAQRPAFHALVEVKSPDKPPSKRRLTPEQAAYHSACPGFCYVAMTTDEVLGALGLARADGAPGASESEGTKKAPG